MCLINGGENNGMFGKKHSEQTIAKQKASSIGRYTLAWFVERDGEELGTKKYHERREMLAARKINYSYDNGLKGKKRNVEATRGASVSRGKMALKGRKEEFAKDISDVGLSMRQIADKYGVSIAAIKYHRKKMRKLPA
jgi:Trp operon repressor